MILGKKLIVIMAESGLGINTILSHVPHIAQFSQQEIP